MDITKYIIIFIPLQQREFSVNLKSVSKLQPIKVLRSQYKMDKRRIPGIKYIY